MEIRIPLETDNDNTNPTDELVISESSNEDLIIFNISDERREVSVLKSDLAKVLKILI